MWNCPDRTSEVELLESESGYFLYFKDEALEVGGSHVGFERDFVL